MVSTKSIKPLKGYKIFNRVFNDSYKYKSSKLLIAVKFDEDNSDDLFLGVSTSKKNSKKAVCRNRVKRLLRESIREINKEKDSLIYFKNIILIWQVPLDKPSLLNYNDVYSEVKGLLNRAISKYNEKNSNSHNQTL